MRWNMVLSGAKALFGDGCTNGVTGMDVAALVIAIIGATTGMAGVVTAVISIRIAGRSATAGDVVAIATKTATEVAQKQLAIERNRHRHELEQRHKDAAPRAPNQNHVIDLRVTARQSGSTAVMSARTDLPIETTHPPRHRSPARPAAAPMASCPTP